MHKLILWRWNKIRHMMKLNIKGKLSSADYKAQVEVLLNEICLLSFLNEN